MTWQELIFAMPGLLAAIVFHEYAHAWTAVRLGDPSPKFNGRLTLHPAKHIDWIGLLMLLVFRFGWARPVEINVWNLASPRRDMLLIAAAGPLANVLVALASAILMQWISGFGLLADILRLAVLYNVFLAVFNLIPIPPLDGSKILRNVLSEPGGRWLDAIEPYGWIILILLVPTGIIGSILSPAGLWLYRTTIAVAGLLG